VLAGCRRKQPRRSGAGAKRCRLSLAPTRSREAGQAEAEKDEGAGFGAEPVVQAPLIVEKQKEPVERSTRLTRVLQVKESPFNSAYLSVRVVVRPTQLWPITFRISLRAIIHLENGIVRTALPPVSSERNMDEDSSPLTTKRPPKKSRPSDGNAGVVGQQGVALLDLGLA